MKTEEKAIELVNELKRKEAFIEHLEALNKEASDKKDIMLMTTLNERIEKEQREFVGKVEELKRLHRELFPDSKVKAKKITIVVVGGQKR